MFEYGMAVCYSGYRENQDPRKMIYPTDEEVLEDLLILAKDFKYIRMYDVSDHAKTVLKVIKKHHIPLKVMLGVEPRGEISNPDCAWGGLHSDEEIKQNQVNNYKQLDRLAELANSYKEIVLGVSIGNENTAFWHHNKMPAHVLADHARYLKTKTTLPVTFCEGAYEWIHNCQELATIVDFISIHVYPLWHKIPLTEAFDVTVAEYEKTIAAYPNKPVIFTEFGWTTKGGKEMDETQTNEEFQKQYLDQMMSWSKKNKVTMFIFEAFDEPWKGGQNPDEPEKHWGIYDVHRKPKLWKR